MYILPYTKVISWWEKLAPKLIPN